MKRLNPSSTGVIVGLFFAGMHFLWCTMIALGLAQMYLDWILGLHSVNNPYTVMPFSIDRSIYLVVFTFIVGYVVGYVGALLCRILYKHK